MDHFRIATANPRQRDYHRSLSLSAVNAVALARGIPWEDSFRLLLRQAHRYSLMPSDRTCVVNMISEAGYRRVKGLKQHSTYTQLSAFLAERYPHITSALVSTVRNTAAEKRLCAVRRAPDPRDGFAVLDTRPQMRSVINLYLPAEEIGTEPVPPEDPDLLFVMKTRPKEESGEYRYFQPNPRSFSIGDCVIRAYAAVFRLSWDEVLDMIAEANEFSAADVNRVDTDLYLVTDHGFEIHEQLLWNGRPLTGAEFCRYMTRSLHRGERILAEMGHRHVAAVVPADTENGRRYVIMDSWDSSGETVGRYFVYTPPAEEAGPEKENGNAAPVTLTVGASLVHPSFGKGTIISAGGKTVTVSFPADGEKKLSVSWVNANCRGA